MPDLKSKKQFAFYTCGKCKGQIPYLKIKGRPRECPECGYGHGQRDVYDVPSTVRLNLNQL